MIEESAGMGGGVVGTMSADDMERGSNGPKGFTNTISRVYSCGRRSRIVGRVEDETTYISLEDIEQCNVGLSKSLY